jgi:uncharacterized membrane protein YbhN (UPF0104 family)
MGPLALDTSNNSGSMRFVWATWERWKKIAHAVGVVQTRILMVVFYFIVVLPLGLIMRITGDPLHLKEPKGGNWTLVHHEEQTLNTAHRQF